MSQPERKLTKHQVEIQFLNGIIIDLKKQLLGYSFNPVDMDRLDEATKHLINIERCKEIGIRK